MKFEDAEKIHDKTRELYCELEILRKKYIEENNHRDLKTVCEINILIDKIFAILVETQEE